MQEYLLEEGPCIGEGSGDCLGPQRVQGSVQRGAPGGEVPRKILILTHNSYMYFNVICSVCVIAVLHQLVCSWFSICIRIIVKYAKV